MAQKNDDEEGQLRPLQHGNPTDAGHRKAAKLKLWVKKTCTVNLVKRRLPLLHWLPLYTLHSALHDCIAGFTVALTAIPQGIAYAAVAGLPVEYGLYTAFAGPLVYTLFGSVAQVTVGPTAVMALMTYGYVLKGGAPYAIVLSFLAGCIELLAGLLNLGWIMEFISGPVISAFCSAAATTVIVSQFKTLLGLKFPGTTFTTVFPGIFKHWQETSLWDTVLGFSFIIFLLVLMNVSMLKKRFPGSRCLRNRHVDSILWLMSICRNAFAVIFGCIIAYCFELYGFQPFNLTGEIKSGIPSFNVPPFSFERLVPNSSLSNSTQPVYELVTFPTILSDLGTGLAMVPLIAVLEQVAIAKAFSNGGKTDSSQEMVAVGLGSIFCSFFGCFPLTASFSRSSVLSASGGKTQLASFFNGGIILISLSFVMPAFYYIPKSVLAAVIIIAVYSMIEFGEILPMWRGRRIELVPFAATYCCCLLINIEYGILIGAFIHLLLLAHEASRTEASYVHYKGITEKIVVTADRNLYFPSVDRFRETLRRLSDKEEPNNRTIVIDLSRVTQIDHTSLKMLKATLAIWNKKGETFSFVNATRSVENALLSVLPSSVIQHRTSIDTDRDERKASLVDDVLVHQNE